MRDISSFKVDVLPIPDTPYRLTRALAGIEVEFVIRIFDAFGLTTQAVGYKKGKRESLIVARHAS